MPECLLGIHGDPAMVEQALVEMAFRSRQQVSAKAQVHLQYALGRQVQTPRSCTVTGKSLMGNHSSWEMPLKVDAYQQDSKAPQE